MKFHKGNGLRHFVRVSEPLCWKFLFLFLFYHIRSNNLVWQKQKFDVCGKIQSVGIA